MDYKGARPKVKLDAMRDSGRYRETQRMKYQLTSSSDSSQFVRSLSVRLSDVLDKVGASSEFRKLHQDCAISLEILGALSNKNEAETHSFFVFGSSSEGTTTPGMKADSDQLYCHDHFPVVDQISDTKDGLFTLMIRNNHTKPGYVKLQWVFNGQPQTVYTWDIDRKSQESDCEGRICMKHITKEDTYYDERNGPADTSTKANVDFVSALRFLRIPEFSTEWLERKRPYNWPSKRMLHKMVSMGCFVVGVGHPASSERTIEWRLSFSLQERELMFSMNIVQHKCYILLKIIKKDQIEPAIGKSISSYHLKTCIFYVIENTNATLWKRSNLVQCVILCLHVLMKWIHEGYCPNYFIKEENMFDRDLHRSQREHIVQYLKKLLSNGCEFLFQINLDYIGEQLKQFMKGVQTEYKLWKAYYSDFKVFLISEIISYMLTLCYSLNYRQTPLEAVKYLRAVHIDLSNTKCIKDHTEQQTQEIISYIKPLVQFQITKSLASLAFITNDSEIKNRLLKCILNQGSHCNIMSSILLQVTVLYKLDHYEQCILILNQLELELSRKPISICRCYFRFKVRYSENLVKELNNTTAASILRRTSTCFMFVRSDIVIIPKALQYEMYRDVGIPKRNQRDYKGTWMALAVVDPMVYLHFMNYLVYENRHSLIHKHLAINKLDLILMSESDIIHHRETGYNLMGWIHFKEGWIQQGFKYFRKSWSIRPHYNAAKFHVMFYLFGDR